MTDEERTIIENYIADELLPDDISGMNGYNKPGDIAEEVIHGIGEDGIAKNRVPIMIGQIIWDNQDEFIRMVKTAFYDGGDKDLVTVPDQEELQKITKENFDKWFEQYKQRVSELIMDSAHSGIGAVTVFRRSSDHDTDVLLKSSNFFEAIVESYPTLAVKKGTTTEVENGKERQVDCIEIRWGDETW